MEIQGFAPIIAINPKILILGTFPGEESLRQRKYYTHPRNLFWNMMECICGAGNAYNYETRVDMLRNAGISLWDVLKSCDRGGSLDSRIRNGHVNDFDTFLLRYPMKAIFFNGEKANALFNQRVISALRTLPPMFLLPSTSPANTRMTTEEKIRRWLSIRQYLE